MPHGQLASLNPTKQSDSQLRMGETILFDTMGKSKPFSRMGHRHVLTFVEHTAKYDSSIPIRSRSEAQHLIKSTIQYIMHEHIKWPRLFHSDNARTFTARGVSTFLTDHGNAKSVICTNRFQQNSVTERWNQNIINEFKVSIHHCQLLESFGT